MKKTQYLKILSFLFIILAIEGIIVLMCKTTKSAKNEDEYKTSVTRIAINPIEKNNVSLSKCVIMESSSEKLLKRMVENIESRERELGCSNKTIDAQFGVKKPTYMGFEKGQRIYYIAIYKNSSVFTSMKEFDFSGLDLGRITKIPDFSWFYECKKLNFSNCGLTEISAFSKYNLEKRSGGLNNLSFVNYVDLSQNKIISIKTDIVSETQINKNKEKINFNLEKQNIYIDLGTVKDGNKAVASLPDIFVLSYGSVPAPKGITVSGLKRDGKKVTIIGDGPGFQIATAKISQNSSSPFRGSTVKFGWVGVWVSTNTNNNNKNNNNNNNNNNNGNYDDTYYYNISLTYNSSSPGGYAREKYIKIWPSKGENVTYNDAKVYVNGNYVGKNTVNYKATKNGTYTIKVTYPGLDDIIFTHKVNGIDTEYPSLTTTYESERDKNTKILKVKAIDNIAIDKILVNGKIIYKCNNKNYYSMYTATAKITETGKYRIEVRDLAGNGYLWDEYVNVDTTPPKIQNVKIKKDDKIYDKDKCGVGIGDKLIIELTANEDVKCYQGIYINETKIDNKYVQVGSKQFAVEIPITEVFGQRKFIWRFKNKNK